MYPETLAEKTFQEEYNIVVNAEMLKEAQQALAALYKAISARPSAYYAIIALDGDSMGERVSKCQLQDHKELSHKLAQFAQQVPLIAENYMAYVIYNGGDDVLAMAPLSTAFEFAQKLARQFQETGGTASAGICIAHHQAPLSAALRAARAAEGKAKHIDIDKPLADGQAKKAAVCVTVAKRSGEILEMRSKWEAAGELFTQMVRLLREEPSGQGQKAMFASKLAYDVQDSAHAFLEADEKFQSELKRLLKRHCNEKNLAADLGEKLSGQLCSWAKALPEGPEELAHWLLLARFAAQGGRE